MLRKSLDGSFLQGEVFFRPFGFGSRLLRCDRNDGHKYDAIIRLGPQCHSPDSSGKPAARKHDEARTCSG
jgi:hypothetical protein